VLAVPVVKSGGLALEKSLPQEVAGVRLKVRNKHVEA